MAKTNDHNWNTYLEQFLKYLQYEKRCSSLTTHAYQTDIYQFYDYIQEVYGAIPFYELKRLHLRSWLVQLMQAKRKPETIARKLSSLKSFFRFLNRRKLVDINPTTGLYPPKPSKRLPTYLDKNSMEQLLEQLTFVEGIEGVRDKLVLELLYQTGMRRSELIHLTDEKIDKARKNLKVLGKGNKERMIPISEQLLAQIETYQALRDHAYPHKIAIEYLLRTDKGEKLYPQFVYRLVKKYLTLVSTQEKKSPHVLRHTFATNMLDEGADLNTIKSILGHSSIASTQFYTHNSIEKLKQVYQQAHPKGERE